MVPIIQEGTKSVQNSNKKGHFGSIFSNHCFSLTQLLWEPYLPQTVLKRKTPMNRALMELFQMTFELNALYIVQKGKNGDDFLLLGVPI